MSDLQIRNAKAVRQTLDQQDLFLHEMKSIIDNINTSIQALDTRIKYLEDENTKYKNITIFWWTDSMTISIDWGKTNTINVPKSDLSLINGTLYELDTDIFRKALKSLEESEAGMVFPKTHNHNTEVSVSGVTYARIIEILSPYSVKFEDGSYSVRLIGSNNNIFDIEQGILVQNQVQVIPTNSGGLIVTQGGGSSLTAEEIAQAVWNTTANNHATSGTFGHKVKLTISKLNALFGI